MSEAVTADDAVPSVGLRAWSGVRWTLIGYVAQSVMRFGNNIILTRILDPGAFGLMTLTLIFITGLELLSDIGVGPAIIQSKRADDPVFLDTAWTVQIIRSGFLFLASAVIAWPAAHYYGAPALRGLVVAAGVGILIRGLTPTRYHVLERRVLLGRLTVLEVGCQLLANIVMIYASWKLRSAWGLMIGALVGDVAKVVFSFLVLPGHRHRIVLEQESVKEMVGVGRWVIVSTAGTYAAMNLDRLVLGRVLSVRDVGIYSIAFQMVSALLGLGRGVGARVLYPLLAETSRLSPERIYAMLRKGRLLWIMPTVAALIVMSIWGDLIIHRLYKPEYWAAGWMLRILAAGSIAAVLNNSVGVIWNALGQFKMNALFNFVQVAVLLTGMLLGNTFYGVLGFVVGVASVELVILPVQSFLMQRWHKLWQPEVDLPVLAISAALVAAGALLR